MEAGGDPHSAWSLFGFAKRLGAAQTEKAVACLQQAGKLPHSKLYARWTRDIIWGV